MSRIFCIIKCGSTSKPLNLGSIEKINSEDAAPVLNALSNLVNWCFQGTTSIDPKNTEPQAPPIINPEIDTDSFKHAAKTTISKSWFQSLAIGVMSATAAILASKGISNKKSDDRDLQDKKT